MHGAGALRLVPAAAGGRLPAGLRLQLRPAHRPGHPHLGALRAGGEGAGRLRRHDERGRALHGEHQALPDGRRDLALGPLAALPLLRAARLAGDGPALLHRARDQGQVAPRDPEGAARVSARGRTPGTRRSLGRLLANMQTASEPAHGAEDERARLFPANSAGAHGETEPRKRQSEINILTAHVSAGRAIDMLCNDTVAKLFIQSNVNLIIISMDRGQNNFILRFCILIQMTCL